MNVTAAADIPEVLQGVCVDALAWFNREHRAAFELSGLVDADAALGAAQGAAFELGLVLCDGEICAREQVRVTPVDDGYRFSLDEAARPDIPPLLDPPPGIRSSWLDAVLERHEFVLLMFYRGLW
ncbi:MAG: hypothetical protein AAF515_11950 [Pseudomonadota bacterium]